MKTKEEKMIAYENQTIEDIPFQEPMSYAYILDTPQSLSDINKSEAAGLGLAVSSLDVNGNFIKDVINARLNTSAKTILGEFTFVGSGAIRINTDADNGIWLSPTGILGKKAGVNTFTLGIDGTANYYGGLAASQITTGTLVVGRGGTGNTSGIAASITNQGSLATLSLVELAQLGTTVIVGGYIKTSLLTADNIIAGTLTGRTVQTAFSGARVEMGGGADWIRFYDATASQAIIYASSGNLLIQGTQPTSDIRLIAGTSGSVDFWTGTTLRGYIDASFFYIDVSATFQFKRNNEVRFMLDTAGAELGGGAGTTQNVKIWAGSGGNFRQVNLLSGGYTYPSLEPFGGPLDLGNPDYKWRHLYLSGTAYVSAISMSGDIDLNSYDVIDVKYLRFNSTYGQVYWGSDLVFDIYSNRINVGKAIKLLVTTTPPANAIDGMMFFHDTWDEVWVFKGGAWKALAYKA